VETDLRDDLFAHLLRLDASFYARHATGEIMSRATNDLQAVRMVAGPAYMYLANTVAVGAFAVTLMVWIDARMTLLVLLPLLLLPAVTVIFGRVIHQRFEKIQEQFGVLSTLVQENLAGVRIVKAYRQEAAQAAAFRGLAQAYMEQNVELARRSGLFYPSLALLGGLAMALALLLGGRAMMTGRITVGDFVAFTLYLGMLGWPMISLGWVTNLFQRGAASMRRISDLFAAESAVVDSPEAFDAQNIRGELEFRGVEFRYPDSDRQVLQEVSFRVPAGSTLAIVGPTGAGKSTIVSLLARLYDPTAGEVLLDGVPLHRWSLARLRSAIGIVPQDAFLFSESISENLGLGFHEADPGARQRRIEQAASVARLHDTVVAFPAGYETILGERGINLSGGQKQRATLARAVARDPRVLLLDDALSAVDTHTETEILAGLRGVLAGRTSVIVSHRVSATMHADHIVVLHEGRVAEQGTHAALLRQGGLYARLQRRQLLAEEVGDDALASVLNDA
jgi:ATP-binding cassette subfamily B protein